MEARIARRRHVDNGDGRMSVVMVSGAVAGEEANTFDRKIERELR